MVELSSLPIVVPGQTKDQQTTVHIDVLKTKHLAHIRRDQNIFSCLNLIGISRFFTKYCMMQYFACQYHEQITFCVMRKIVICKNIFMMLCVVQFHIVSRKRGLSQKILNCSSHHFAFWLIVTTDRHSKCLVVFYGFTILKPVRWCSG